MRDPVHYLEDILESMTLIERFVEGMELDDFRKDIKTSDAVIKRRMCYGDIKHKKPAWRGRNPEPYRNMSEIEVCFHTCSTS